MSSQLRTHFLMLNNSLCATASLLRKTIRRKRNLLTIWALIVLLVLNPLYPMAAKQVMNHWAPELTNNQSGISSIPFSIVPMTNLQQDELSLAYLASSQDTINLDKRQTDRMVLAIIGASNLRQRRLSELIGPSLGLMVELYKVSEISSALNPAEVVPLFNLNRNNLSLANVLPPKNALRVGIVTASEISAALGRTVPAVSQTIIEKINLEIRGEDYVKKTPLNDVLRPLQYADLNPKVDEYLRAKIEEAHDLAQSNASFLEVFTQVFAELMAERMTDNAATAINNSPNTPDFVKSWIKPDGSISVTGAEAMNRYNEQFEAARQVTDENLALLRAINTGQYAPPDQTSQAGISNERNSSEPQADQPDPEDEKHKKRDELISKVEKGINIAAAVISFFNPAVGAKVRAVGETVIGVARGINNFVNTARQILKNPLVKSLANKVLKYGAPLLAGGLIGAAFKAFSLFRRGQSGPDPEVLRQLELIRKQIDQLRTEMHDRFDQVDTKLNEIFDALEAGFRNLTGDLDATRQKLIELNADLSRFESNVYGWFDDLSRQPLQETINLAIGYKQRTGLGVTLQDFDLYSNRFFTYATVHSKGQVATGSRTRDYSDSKAFDELDKFPPEVNLNYLAQFPARNLGLPALSNTWLANARYWTVSSVADTTLRIESPDNDKRIPSADRRREIYDTGKQIQAAVEAVTILNTSNGPKANRPLFDALLAKYNAKANALSQAIKKVEDDYKNDPANAVIKDVNIWGDANQATSYVIPVPGEPKICGSGSPDAQMRAPSNIGRIDQVMPNPIRLAGKLGVWQLEYCWSFNWGGAPPRAATNNLTIRLVGGNRVLFGGQDSGWLAVLSLGGLFTSSAHDFALVGRYWNNNGYKVRFEQNASLTSVYTNAQVENAANAANSALRNHRRMVMSKVLDELSRASVVQSAARELSGAKKLLESYIALGLSRSLEENDTLRSLLYGDQQVPDENLIKAAYEAAIKSLQEGKPAQRIDVLSLATPRINSLSEVLHSILDDLVRFRLNYPQDALFYSNPEALISVDNTLQEMEVHSPAATLGKLTVAHSLAITAPANQPQAFTLAGFDSDGAPLRFSVVDSPKRGRLTGREPYLIYTPDKDFVGRDSLTFKVIGTNDSNPATVSINVTGVLCASQNFRAVPIFGNGTAPQAVVARDFNRDGKLDIAITDAGANSVSVLLGDGSGNFTTPTRVAVGTNPQSLTADDFNRDGRLDLATANYRANNVSILLGNAAGGFNPAASPTVGSGPRGIAAGDFDRDGKPDLAIANLESKSLSIVIGNGDGSFKSAANLALSGAPADVEVADFNGDGKADVAVVLNDSASIIVLLGKGDVTFEAAANYTVDQAPISITTGDFNEDGELDLAVANQGAKKVSLLLGDGFGRFRQARNFEANVPATSVAVGDFNRDAHSDLVVAGHTANGVAVLLGDGFGGLGTPTVHSVGKSVSDVVVGDFNSDNNQDVIAANYDSPNIFLLSTSCAVIPTVATISAANFQAPIASESLVSAFGSALATGIQVANSLPLPTTLGGTKVTVKDSLGSERPAPLFFVSPAQVNYLMPPGVASGVATVTVTNANNVSTSGDVRIAPVAPGLFSANASGQGIAAATVLRIKADGTQQSEPVGRYDPAQGRFVAVPIDLGAEGDQVFLLLFGTGARNRSTLSAVTATVGGAPCEVLYAGAQGGFAGLDQINLRLPRSLSGRGEVDIALNVDGVSANIVRTSIK